MEYCLILKINSVYIKILINFEDINEILLKKINFSYNKINYFM